MTTITAEDRIAVERARVAMNRERADAGQDTGFCVECGDEMAVVPTPTGGRFVHVNGRTDHAPRLWLVDEDGRPVLGETPLTQPVEITCPGLGCRARAWRMPDDKVYCEEIGGVVPEEGEDGDVPALPAQYLTDPERLLTVVHVSGEAQGRQWDQSTYETQVLAAGLLLAIAFPTASAPEPVKVCCTDCKYEGDNHYPCGEDGCGCYCRHPDTPEHMKRPPRFGGLS